MNNQLTVGNFLYFIPYKYADDVINKEKKPRYMLIVDITDDFIYLTNISSIHKKEAKLFLYPSNRRICDYYPLPHPSYAKLDCTYMLEQFDGIEKFLFSEDKLNKQELDLIVHEVKTRFKSNLKCLISKSEFLEFNTIKQSRVLS